MGNMSITEITQNLSVMNSERGTKKLIKKHVKILGIMLKRNIVIMILMLSHHVWLKTSLIRIKTNIQLTRCLIPSCSIK